MKLGYFIDLYVTIISDFLVFLFRLKNFKKKKIFIYTDSRGFEITKIFNRKNPFSSYISHFVKNYNCKVYVCPEKHTTLFDFLYTLNKESINYDYVIAHVGVVDFSPRQISQISNILDLKKRKIISIFSEKIYNDILNFQGYDTLYEKEKTSAILPENQIENMAKKFNEIENLIWISCNPIDLNWDGNYPRKRPKNINIVNTKSKELIKSLTSKGVVDLTEWTSIDIRKYTCDNIHLGQEGMNFLVEKIEEKIEFK
jgi:hypothetical protein